MHCLDCGFEFDEMNESQPVCPRCGADPNELSQPTPDPAIVPGNDLIN